MEYPPDYMSLYAQGYSLADYLIQTGGRRKYVEFLDDGLKTDDWSGAARRCYALDDLGILQNTWLGWVRQGAPRFERQPSQLLAAAAGRRPRPEPNLIYRVRNQPSQPTPPGALVPIHFPADGNSTANHSPRPLAGEGQGVRAAAAPSAERVAVNVPRSEPKVLPASGWHAAGTTPPESVASSPSRSGDESSSASVAHPQPIEQPR